jgi:hypothetical protein
MVLDLTPVINFFSLPTDIIIKRIIILFGWIPVSFAFIIGAKEMWLFYINTKWGSKIKHILLAIDIPRNNVQSPKAVENLFTYLAGAHTSSDLIEKYWEGKYQLSFSFEIVSIEGYTQFLVRTPEDYRNLVETAIYAQYPDAEITEVEDYAKSAPTHFPDDEYDVWGSEFIQDSDEALPIKTYKDFEHQFGPLETLFRDPLASLMDLCASLNKGEQIWFQIIIQPTDYAWTKNSEKVIKKILKEKDNGSGGIIDYINDFLFFVLSGFTSGAATEEKKDESLKMMNLKPGEKEKIDAIQLKASQLGFLCKLRMVYLAKKEVMNKPKATMGFVGWIKQFSQLNLNSLKPDSKYTMTSVHYFYKTLRLNGKKGRIVNNYAARDGSAGRAMKIFSIEELATLWHFPIDSVVKAPLIQKTSGRKVEPPMSLPFYDTGQKAEDLFEADFKDIIESSSVQKKDAVAAQDKSDLNDDFVKEIILSQDGEDTAAVSSAEDDSSEIEAKAKVEPPKNLPFV